VSGAKQNLEEIILILIVEIKLYFT